MTTKNAMKRLWILADRNRAAFLARRALAGRAARGGPPRSILSHAIVDKLSRRPPRLGINETASLAFPPRKSGGGLVTTFPPVN